MMAQFIFMVAVLFGAFVLLATATICIAFAVDNYSRKKQ